MVRKSVLFPKFLITIFAIFLSANNLFAFNDKGKPQKDLFTNYYNVEKQDPNNILNRIYVQAIDLFEKNGLSVRESIDLETEATKPENQLDSSDYSFRKFVQVVNPAAWGIEEIKAKRDEYILIEKKDGHKLLKGGPELHYQPLTRNTKILAKFTRTDLDSEEIEEGEHTLLVVPYGTLGVAKKEGRFIILKVGFHHLQQGETFEGLAKLNVLLDGGEKNKAKASKDKKVDASEDKTADAPEGNSTVKNLVIGKSGFILQKAILEDPDSYYLSSKKDGEWVILKSGLYLYPPFSAPLENFESVPKFSSTCTKKITIGSTGITVKACYTVSLMTKTEYENNRSLLVGDEHSYPQYLRTSKKKSGLVIPKINRILETEIIKHSSQYADEEDNDVNKMLSPLAERLDRAVKEKSGSELQSSQLRITFDSLKINNDGVAVYWEKTFEEKQKDKLEDLKRNRARKERDFKIESDNLQQEHNEKLIDNRRRNEQDHQLAVIKAQGEQVISRAKADEAAAAATKTKAKAKKAKAKAEQKSNRKN